VFDPISIQRRRKLKLSSSPFDIVEDQEKTADKIRPANSETQSIEWIEDQEKLSLSSKEGLSRIFFSSCLITANTVGSAILTVPDVAREAGVVVPALVFLAIYVINVITGLFISEEAIVQYENGTPASEVPTSFKDIADRVFGSTAGSIMAALSVLFNYCIIIFNVIRFGNTADALIPWIDSSTSSMAFAALLTCVVATFSNVNLSKVTSVSVSVLFASFVALVLPGLPQSSWGEFVTNAGGYFHGSASFQNILSSLTVAAPLVLYSTEIQKIIPSVTKLCNFDRAQTFASVTVGGAVPVVMYVSFGYLVLGGGIDLQGGGFLMTLFTLATVCGASVASSMSLSEEFQSFLIILRERLSGKNAVIDIPLPESFMLSEEDKAIEVLEELPKEGQTYSLPAVLLAVIPPLLMGLHLSQDDSSGVMASIEFAGGYLLPVFVWFFPAMLEWKRQNDLRASGQIPKTSIFNFKNLSIYSVAACALGLIAVEASHDFSFPNIGDLFNF